MVAVSLKKKESRFQQKDINATPKIILKNYFQCIEEKRIGYEEQILIYKKQITILENKINDFKTELKTPNNLTINEIKSIKEMIKDLENDVNNAKKEIRLIIINCNILWKNQLKMDKILKYGLEE